jgi:hypothetical protein
LTGFIAR